MATEDPASQIWVSELNRSERIRAPFRGAHVRFYDTTLRDGEQTVGVVLGPTEKVEIARALDRLGVSRIEAGFPRVSDDDAEAIRRIVEAGLKAEIWGFSRAVREDVDELIKLGLQYTVIEAPTSAIKLSALSLTGDKVIQRITDAVGRARAAGICVAFFAVDATRTDLDFLRRAYLSALDAGASELVVVDTIGACGPEAAEDIVGAVRTWVGPSVPLHWHGHNDFGLATASALAAVRAGANWIHATVNGMGERAGNGDLGEIATALTCLYGVPIDLDLTQIRSVSGLVSGMCGYQLEPWKPVVGRDLFVRESGAVAAQFHLPRAIEPYAAALVGATRGIVLGKKSGLDSIDLKCRELELPLPTESRAPVLAAVKAAAVRKRGLLTDAEFRQLVAGFGESNHS